ncbi:hypothetical protein S827_20350 [Salmonella enterica subsp. enterica serovar Give]|nr:hypothetical protein [Salmonella enterica subsp. enterica serovar Give]ECM0137967.1 hypothetical protein [Salmonella enterica subsp. enterica serovar Give]
MLQLCATALNVTCVASLKMNKLLKKESGSLTGKTIWIYFLCGSLWGGDQFRTEFVHLKSACSP